MPHTHVSLFRDDGGRAPLLDWLDALPSKVAAKCRVRIERLGELGRELRRPEADYLRDGVYELRVRHLSVNYRILYFFHGRDAVVLSHGLTKERTVPTKEIDLAVVRKRQFEEDPRRRTYRE